MPIDLAYSSPVALPMNVISITKVRSDTLVDRQAAIPFHSASVALVGMAVDGMGVARGCAGRALVARRDRAAREL